MQARNRQMALQPEQKRRSRQHFLTWQLRRGKHRASYRCELMLTPAILWTPFLASSNPRASGSLLQTFLRPAATVPDRVSKIGVISRLPEEMYTSRNETKAYPLASIHTRSQVPTHSYSRSSHTMIENRCVGVNSARFSSGRQWPEQWHK